MDTGRVAVVSSGEDAVRRPPPFPPKPAPPPFPPRPRPPITDGTFWVQRERHGVKRPPPFPPKEPPAVGRGAPR